MTRGARKLSEQVRAHLTEGERIESLHPVRRVGSLDAAAFGGAIGAAAGAATGAFMAMAVTNRRLLLFSVGGVARLDDLLSEVPIADVDSIEVRKVMLGSRKRVAVAARGGSFELEAPGRARVEELTEAFERARSTPG